MWNKLWSERERQIEKLIEEGRIMTEVRDDEMLFAAKIDRIHKG
jgi:hypothetical protein